MALQVAAPLAGMVVPLGDVPDPVFANALVGPGVAIDPRPEALMVRAPVAGRLVKVKPHAFVVVATAIADQDAPPNAAALDRGILVHLGIDTVKLGGAGFVVLRDEGEMVRAGDPIIRWRPGDVAAAGLSPVCPVVALDAATVADIAAGAIGAGDTLFTWP